MESDKGLVFLEIAKPVEGVKIFIQHNRYLDGIALDSKIINYQELKESLLTTELKNLRAMLLLNASRMDAGNFMGQLGGELGNIEILVAFAEFGELREFSRSFTDSNNNINVKVGLMLNHPVTSLSQYSKAGVDFIIMPPALIRGRILAESKARQVDVIARIVNDVATFATLLESGVYAIVTTVPTIKREAKRILKL